MNLTTKIPEAYTVLEKSYIEELKSDAWLLKHKKSGARIALLSNDDDNKVFHVAFRTPPTDSTALHIFWNTRYSAVRKNFRSRTLL